MAEVLKLVNGTGGRPAAPLPDLLGTEPTLSAASEADARSIIEMLDRIETQWTATVENLGADPAADLAKACGALRHGLETLAASDPSRVSADLQTGVAGVNADIENGTLRPTAMEKLRGKHPPAATLIAELETLDLPGCLTQLRDIQSARKDTMRDVRADFGRATDAFNALGLAIAAGKERVGRETTNLAEKHAETLALPPENRSAASDDFLAPLRRARDDIERRVHALRTKRQRAFSALSQARALISAEIDLTDALSKALSGPLKDHSEALEKLLKTADQTRNLDLGATRAALAQLPATAGPLGERCAPLNAQRSKVAPLLAALADQPGRNAAEHLGRQMNDAAMASDNTAPAVGPPVET